MPQATGWTVLERRLILERKPYLVVHEEDLCLPDGKVIPGWLNVAVPPFAMIFAVLEDGRVPFVRQFRPPLGRYTLELPAGHLEGDEDPLICAQRELHEEAGVEAPFWRYLGHYVMDGNRGCGEEHVFLAQGGRIVAPPHHGDVGELTLHLLTMEDLEERWLAGDFNLAPVTLAIGLALHLLRRP